MTDMYETAKALRLEICRLYGVDPNNCPGEALGRMSDWSSCMTIMSWLRAGYEPDWIRGVISEASFRRRDKFWHPSRLSYFTKILETEAAKAAELPPAPERKSGVSRDRLVDAYRAWKITRRWRVDDHVPPDHPSFPQDIIVEANARRVSA